MDPKVRKSLIFLLFIGASIYGLLNLRDRTDDQNTQPSPAANTSQPAQAVRPSNLIDIDKYSELPWGRDPFTRNHEAIAEPSQASGPVWTLGGILYDDQNPAAIINGRVVRIGQSIEGALLLKIDKDKVTLENNGTRFSLNLNKDKS